MSTSQKTLHPGRATLRTCLMPPSSQHDELRFCPRETGKDEESPNANLSDQIRHDFGDGFERECVSPSHMRDPVRNLLREFAPSDEVDVIGEDAAACCLSRPDREAPNGRFFPKELPHLILRCVIKASSDGSWGLVGMVKCLISFKVVQDCFCACIEVARFAKTSRQLCIMVTIFFFFNLIFNLACSFFFANNLAVSKLNIANGC